nr:hypothetical protein [Nocardioides palaemonis]
MHHPHPGRAQPGGVRIALGPQHVALGRQDDRRRQPGEVVGQQR